MGLLQKANAILTIKQEMATAIENKGVSMTGATFSDFPYKISLIGSVDQSQIQNNSTQYNPSNMTMQEKADAILQIKSDISSAISAHGVDMTTATFADYPSKISQIPTGGSTDQQYYTDYSYAAGSYTTDPRVVLYYNIKHPCKLSLYVVSEISGLTVWNGYANFEYDASGHAIVMGEYQNGYAYNEDGGWNLEFRSGTGTTELIFTDAGLGSMKRGPQAIAIQIVFEDITTTHAPSATEDNILVAGYYYYD